MQCLVRLVQAHEDFRLAEIEALSTLANVKVNILSYNKESPYCIVHFPDSIDSNTAAKIFISRSILARGIYELWASGTTYDQLHADCTKRSQQHWPLYKYASFKFSIDAYGCKKTSTQQVDIINSFRYLGFEGPIRMQDAEVEFMVFEEWDLTESPRHQSVPEHASVSDSVSMGSEALRVPKRIFFGRHIASSCRQLVDKHDLKKRPYISKTSMDAGLALVTANLALAAPGKVFFDPFVGTGGFLVSATEFGALSFGSDIDGRSFRGKGRGIETGVGANFHKYGLEGLFGDCIISDLTNTPLVTRDRRWLDGIICDPPYGIREGPKVLGNRNTRVVDGQVAVHQIDGVPAYTLPDYVAPKKPYSFLQMLDDILSFAAETLVDGGRLAFWVPVANDADEEIELPAHSRLRLLHCCLQPFNKWSRRLLVYERQLNNAISTEANRMTKSRTLANGSTADALNPFRRKYFQGFRGSHS